ncbi:MAG: hypothetical protein JKP98_01635 [Rhodobacteraceae bacterium]|nr:hypothetical protein [Paracoccaceae bacterium]
MKRCSPPALLLVLGLGLGLGFPATAAPQLPSGAYLAARQASMTEDFAPAARQYDRLLAAAPNDPRFLQGAVLAHIGAGQMDRAADLATRLMETGARSRAATLARMAASLRAGDYQAVVDGFAAGQRFAPMVDDLIRAWALLGAGRTADAMAAFDAGAAAGDHAPFRRYNAALARAVSGDPKARLPCLTRRPSRAPRRSRRAPPCWPGPTARPRRWRCSKRRSPVATTRCCAICKPGWRPARS